MSLNTFIFSGFVVKEPTVIKEKEDAKPYVRFRMENRKNFRCKMPYNFIDFVAKGKVAEFCMSFLKLGQYITVQGELSSKPILIHNQTLAMPEMIVLRVFNDKTRDMPIDVSKLGKSWEQFWSKYEGFEELGAYRHIMDDDENPLAKVKTKDDFWDNM